MSTYYVQTSLISGGGGNSFSNVSTTATPINDIYIWSNSAAILAIQVDYADNSTFTAGSPREAMSQLSLAPGEQVTNLSMMLTDGTTTGGHIVVGQITIQTNRGQNRTMGPGGSSTYNVGMESGLFVGITGSAGDAIDGLSFYCLRRIQSVSVSIPDTEWSDLIGKSTGITPQVLDSQIFPAPKSTSLPWSFSGSSEVSDTSTFTQAASQTYGVEVTVSGMFLGIGASATGSWSRETTTTQESSATHTYTMGETITGTVPANNYVIATTTCQLGQISLPYTSTVTITFQDSSISPVSFQQSGMYNNVTYANGTTTATDPQPITSSSLLPDEVKSILNKITSTEKAVTGDLAPSTSVVAV